MFFLWVSVLGLFLFALYRTNAVCKYIIKISSYYILTFLLSIFVIPFTLHQPGSAKNHWMPMWLCKYFVRPIFKVTAEVEGVEHVKSRTDNFLIISNHQSSIDMFIVCEIWPECCVSMAKKELLYTGPFGVMLWLLGTVFVNRQKAGEARSSTDNAVERLKKEKLRIWVFPEGTRNHDSSTMLPFKKGAFHLAKKAKVAILPVVIASYESFYSKPGSKFDRGRMFARCLPAISVEEIEETEVGELAEKTQKMMVKHYDELSQLYKAKVE